MRSSRLLGASLVVAAAIAFAVSFLLPVARLGTMSTLKGHQAVRLAFEWADDSDQPLRDRWPYVLGSAANLLFAAGIAYGWMFTGRRTYWTAAGLCLAAGMAGRASLIAFYGGHNWTARSMLIGFWVWIAAMLLASAGFAVLALALPSKQRSASQGRDPELVE